MSDVPEPEPEPGHETVGGAGAGADTDTEPEPETENGLETEMETGAGTEEQLDALAEAFGLETDPLAGHSATFKQNGIDLFALFERKVLAPEGLAPDTLNHYRATFRQWCEFMTDDERHPAREAGRHPACPNTGHVLRYIRYQRDVVGIRPVTVNKKLQRLNRVYEWWQKKQRLPHPTTYNPFEIARAEVDLSDSGPKEPPRIPLETLRDILAGVTNARDRAIITAQFKLGLRVGELCNIKLEDFDIQNSELREHYPDMGTNPGLSGWEDAVYIPSCDGREGNKSQRPRVLPLDEETRSVLLHYLLVRPDAGKPWLFLSTTSHSQMEKTGVQNVWSEYFREAHPEYDGTDRHRAITSHFGRHYFTTWWEKSGTPRELVNYMRGDKPGAGNGSVEGRRAINAYIHIYYEDIEEVYRENIYRLGV